MKNLHIVIFIAGLLLVGCSKNDIIENEVHKDVLSFSSVQANLRNIADTRVSVINDNTSNNKSLTWNQNDRILVFSDSQHYFNEYLMISYEGDKGVFSGSEISGNKFYALYPSLGWSIDESDSNILHYSGLSYNYNSTATSNNFKYISPMVAVSDDNNFSFKHTTGLIHVSISNIQHH